MVALISSMARPAADLTSGSGSSSAAANNGIAPIAELPIRPKPTLARHLTGGSSSFNNPTRAGVERAGSSRNIANPIAAKTLTSAFRLSREWTSASIIWETTPSGGSPPKVRINISVCTTLEGNGDEVRSTLMRLGTAAHPMRANAKRALSCTLLSVSASARIKAGIAPSAAGPTSSSTFAADTRALGLGDVSASATTAAGGPPTHFNAFIKEARRTESTV